ncbi:MAG: polyprenyl diphosphate synthase [Candidatus Dojkabacteria bacterium]
MHDKELKIEIFGLVQGVNLRRNLSKVANLIGLKGYVENKSDGSVLVVAQGPESKLDELLSWVQKAPFPVRVTGMSYEWRKIEKKYKKFKVEKKDSFVKDEARSLLNLSKELVRMRSEQRIPRHVVIIPDGNRRWARERGLHPWMGHKQSTEFSRLKAYFDECREMGVEYLTFWALSTENLTSRDPKEVKMLFKMLKESFKKYKIEFVKEEVRFRHFGRKDRLPEDVLKVIADLEDATKHFDGLNAQLCLDYGGRDDIVRAFNKMLEDGVKHADEKLVSDYLDGSDIPDPDLIIRTSGEHRTSGIMAFQATYAELYFTNVYFPDFGAEQFKRAILDFAGRVRRFGGTAKEDLKLQKEAAAEKIAT